MNDLFGLEQTPKRTNDRPEAAGCAGDARGSGVAYSPVQHLQHIIAYDYRLHLCDSRRTLLSKYAPARARIIALKYYPIGC